MLKTLTSKLGDTSTFSIPLRWEKRAFVPGNAWALLFTVKSDPDTQDDSQRLLQKATGGYGIIVTGSTAEVAIQRADTIRAAVVADPLADPPIEAQEAFEAAPGTYYWDVQATHLTTGKTRTVASGNYDLKRDVTRQSEPTGPIFTTEDPVFAVTGPHGMSAYEVAVANGFVGTEQQWLASLQGTTPGMGTNSVTIGPNAPANPQDGDTWIDTNGWIESYWRADIDGEGDDQGYWVSVQPAPSNTYELYWSLYRLVWTDPDTSIAYYLNWTPPSAT